jgi:DNA polymerase III delta prime subunit
MNEIIPWVEKYRPSNFDNIVLDKNNKKILNNIIEKQTFPNLLFYGPPGTGKTTTIINMINSYQKKVNNVNKGLYIHLNASDERGIEIIRNQIYNFANSKPLFTKGVKFVILDEVDYMTKNAQQALRYLIENFSNNDVKFCLICNYISKIDESLQNEFIRIRFNQLPKDDIVSFLKTIAKNENLKITSKEIISIQELYISDMRSMINYLQLNYTEINEKIKIIDSKIWENLLSKIKMINNKKNEIYIYISHICSNYNIDKKHIIKKFLNYIILNKKEILTLDMFKIIENLMHNNNCDINDYTNYFVSSFQHELKKLD